MKTRIKLLCIFLVFAFLATGCSFVQNAEKTAKKPVIGAVFNGFDDTWRTDVRNNLYKLAKDKVRIDIWSGNQSQDTENKKVDLLIKNKVDVLIMNLTDKSGASRIIEKAKKADIPVIFFNVEPLAEDLKKWDKVYYVGAKAEQSGIMQGQVLAEYFKNNPPPDGAVDYVMIKGPAEHQDAILRTKYSVETMKQAGLKLNMLAEDIALWDREKAQEKMQTFLKSYESQIDCVIANNDDMALGAIDALKANGYFKEEKYMPVVGVDSTSKALNALTDGTLLGTALNDAVKQSEALISLSNILAKKETPNKDNFSFPITDNKYIWVEYKMIKKENIKDAQ